MNFTGEIASESVARGHPDKLADQISDAVLDACLRLDTNAKVACECFVKDNKIVVGGEIHSRKFGIADLDIRAQVQRVLEEVGYSAAVFGSVENALCYAGVAAESFELIDLLGEQSQNIRVGVEKSNDSIGAGDQGFVYGYACNDTPALMPAPVHYCQRMMRLYHKLLKSRSSETDWRGWPRPDAKCQLTFRYRDGVPVEITGVTVSAQHAPLQDTDSCGAEAVLKPDSEIARMQSDIVDNIIRPALPDNLIGDDLRAELDGLDLDPGRSGRRLFINPTRSFTTGGPKGDAGLTGRKIIVDTYGGLAHHGGGAFSGKDPTKVDRSAAYMARHIAKNLVAAQACERCEVMIGYVIGFAEPVAVHVNSHGGQAGDNSALAAMVKKEFDLSPRRIIEHLDLRRPIFSSTACYGHFGQDEDSHSWEYTTAAHRFNSSTNAA
ncbi:MAG: methionine adenosyltransferase [Gammaproteobacteria bacterium]|nr:methionine adenosyltransferase [Gammaproteobacteria bacterium]